MKEKFRTSRGQFQEMEEVVTNLLAAVEHLQDTSLDDQNIKLIADIRDARGKLIKQMFPKDQCNIAYHCAYKHLLLAKMQMKETMQSKITKGEAPYDDEVTLSQINDSLKYVTAKYLNLEFKEGECKKCLEDYMMGFDEFMGEEPKQTKSK